MSKILTLDIETAPNIGAFFELYREGNILWKSQEWYVLCAAAKWLGDDGVMVASLPDYKLYKREKHNDRELLQTIWNWLDEADIVITQNGDEFDIKKLNARFLVHGMLPPSPFKSVDTKKALKANFKFDSNSLKPMTKLLGIEEKTSTEGRNLWYRICMEHDVDAWLEMCEYNAQDVRATEALYLRLRPWIKNHPSLNLFEGTLTNCPNCKHPKLHKRGYSYTRSMVRQRYQCQGCGAWASGETIKLEGQAIR